MSTNLKRAIYVIVLITIVNLVNSGFFSDIYKTLKDQVSRVYRGNKGEDIQNSKDENLSELEKEFEDLLISDTNEVPNFKLNINQWAQLERKKWHRMSHDQLKLKFGYLSTIMSDDLKYSKDIGIRESDIYVPANYSESKKPVVIVVLHGTFVPEAPDYYDPTSIFYSNVLRFGKQMADKEMIPVEVISFKWSGHNNTPARQNAAVILASLLNEFYSDYKVFTIAHSHGCNVVNNATRLLSANLFVDHAIHLACPVRDKTEDKFKPLQFKKLTQFYSNSDLVAAIGAITTDDLTSLSCRKFELQDLKKIKNLRVMLNGTDPGHSNSRNYIIFNLLEILNIVDNKYILNNDLIINLETDIISSNPVLIAVRNYVKPESLSNDSKNVKEQLKKEIDFSESQKDIFKSIYHKDMSLKYNQIYRLLNGVYQELITICS